MEWLWLSLIGLFCIQLLGLMLPGADFVMVVRSTLKYRRKSGLLTALGITIGVLIYASIVVFLLEVIGQYFTILNNVITLFGIGYLSYIGWQCLRSSPNTDNFNDATTQTMTHNPFLNGLICNLSNPKVMVFFASILPIYVHKSPMLSFHVAIVAVMSISTLLWFSFVALCISNPKVKTHLQKSIHTIEKVFGVLLIVFAMVLAVKLTFTLMG